jgi:hypothetical protein
VKTLFGEDKTATLSKCGLYRYTLTRIWDADKPSTLFIMLNPSTADSEEDDPTIRRCMGFARAWGCGTVEVVNLFAYRATEPALLASCARVAPGVAVGRENDSYIRACVEMHSNPGDYIVAAWGAWADRKELRFRREQVLRLLPLADLMCLDVTQTGQPKHPLYCRADLTPTKYGG